MVRWVGEVRWERGGTVRTGSDLPRPLESADCLASPPIRHASIDEARLDVSMTEVILYEVDRLTCIQKMCRHRVTHRVYVPAVGREIGEGGVPGEECLYPASRTVLICRRRAP